MVFNAVLGIFSRDVGIDLGTANTLVFARGKGIVVREPTVVAQHTGRGEVLAVGSDAKKMIGRTPTDVVAVRPLRRGAIADFDMTVSMLSYCIRRGLRGRGLPGPRVVVAIPPGATAVEKRAVMEATIEAGARATALFEQPLAAALGAGVPFSDPVGTMIVDIGGGTTGVAIIASGSIVTAHCVRVGGDDMDEAIVQHARKAHHLLIGQQTAEEIKTSIGSAHPREDGRSIEVRGQDLASGLPRTVRMTSAGIRESLTESVRAIVGAVKTTLEETPPELATDISDRGILMTGGGSLLRGLARRLTEETGVPAVLTDDPLSNVALGTGRALEAIETLPRALITSERRSG
jgi:rod shape-determining protein MreB